MNVPEGTPLFGWRACRQATPNSCKTCARDRQLPVPSSCDPKLSVPARAADNSGWSPSVSAAMLTSAPPSSTSVLMQGQLPIAAASIKALRPVLSATWYASA